MRKPQILISIILIVLAGCLPAPSSTPALPSPLPLDEQQVINIVWQAFDPNTSSHDQTAWDIIEVRNVTGQEVQDLFKGDTFHLVCTPGPTPPANASIVPDGSYWYVEILRHPVTPRPMPTELYSPTARPIIPEPYVYEAHFLVDAITGQVVARKISIFCVIY